MASISERSCSLLVPNDKSATFQEIKTDLEGNDAEAKTTAMKKAVMAILNGEQLPALFITIVRYVLPSEDHGIQKLLLLYLVRVVLDLPMRAHAGLLLLNCAWGMFVGSIGEDRFSREAASRNGALVGTAK